MKTIAKIAKEWIRELGIYEPGKPIEEVARELGLDADGIIKMASNENALGPSPAALAAMRQTASEMHRYPDGAAYYLRRAIARKLAVEPNQVIVGNGSNELLELIGHVFLEEDLSIVVADRAFVVYKLIAAACRAETIAVPMRNFTHDLDAMLNAIRDNTRVVFISNPNNPTGTMVTGDEIDQFMTKVPDHVVVVLDEAYVELLPPDKQPDVLKHIRDGRNVILMRTFSKTYGLAGLRIGYGIASEECVALLNRVRQPFNANAMAQAAALAALEDHEHVERTRNLVRDGLGFFERSFSDLNLSFVPSVANFILVDVSNGRKVFEAMQKDGVIVRPMDVYGLPSYIRITVGTSEENTQCVKALKKAIQ